MRHGFLSATLARVTRASKIIGIDPFAGFIEYARTQIADPRVTFEVGDAQNLPYPSSYGASVIGITRDSAVKSGIPALDVAAWEEDLRSRTAEGEWFFCLDRFVFTGTKA
jgi:hypothetical protein